MGPVQTNPSLSYSSHPSIIGTSLTSSYYNSSKSRSRACSYYIDPSFDLETDPPVPEVVLSSPPPLPSSPRPRRVGSWCRTESTVSGEWVLGEHEESVREGRLPVLVVGARHLFVPTCRGQPQVGVSAAHM